MTAPHEWQPIAPCDTCRGLGVIGGFSGQTPEQFEYHTEDCPDCTPASQPLPADSVGGGVE